MCFEVSVFHYFCKASPFVIGGRIKNKTTTSKSELLPIAFCINWINCLLYLNHKHFNFFTLSPVRSEC